MSGALSFDTESFLRDYLEAFRDMYVPRGPIGLPDPNNIPPGSRPGKIDPLDLFPEREFDEYFFEHADELVPKLLHPKTVEPTPLDPTPLDPPRPVSPPRDPHDTSGPEYLVLIGLPLHNVPEGWA